MKKLILFVTFAFSAISSAQIDLVKAPDLSMIKTATIMEIMQILSKPENKVYWLCNEDIRLKIQNKLSRLSAPCRSELNRVVIKDSDIDSPEVSNLALEITKDAATDQEKLFAIYDWITRNISYDVDTYTQIVKQKKILPNPLDLISTSNTLKRRIAVAEGYSLLTAALLRAVNIPTVVVIGYALKDGTAQGVHTWNEAYLDDRWINLDTTWDAGGITGNPEQGLKFVSRPSRQHLDMPDTEFKKTHKVVFDIK